MTSTVESHYERVLGPVYTWMMGGAEKQLDANRRFFDEHRIRPGERKGALDLGAGCGFQSIPLAELGFSVTAVDLSELLLRELRERAGDLAIRTLRRDLLPVTELAEEPQGLVVCLGDTLTHLPDQAAVEALVAGAACTLDVDGHLVLRWRDLQTLPEGDARFLPIRSSPERIFTCFLEAIDDRHVRVTDLVHERDGEGFAQRVGSYVKLRIAAARVDALLADHGFTPEVATESGGLVTRIARRKR